jgi:Uma2 family endonuclease
MTTTIARPTFTLRSLSAEWDYQRWANELPEDGNRYEVIEGVLYMTTAPSYFHQWIIIALLNHIGIPLQKQKLVYTAIAPIGLLMPGCDPVQPDFVLVSHERADIIAERRIRGVPDLIAEVLSPSNAEQDTEIKRHVYARAGLPEYWIIRPATRDVLVCRDPDQTLGDFSTSQLISADEILSPLRFPVSVNVSELFAGAPDTTV